jgi:hypothetical protein
VTAGEFGKLLLRGTGRCVWFYHPLHWNPHT